MTRFYFIVAAHHKLSGKIFPIVNITGPMIRRKWPVATVGHSDYFRGAETPMCD